MAYMSDYVGISIRCDGLGTLPAIFSQGAYSSFGQFPEVGSHFGTPNIRCCTIL